jgi:phospholipid/cholesterol/gamma-HCH transport system substrate-binding protein
VIMDTARSALQVGILVCLGALLFGYGYVFFNGTLKSQRFYTVTVEFKNAGGISSGAAVEMSGVTIGQVAPAPVGVTLDSATDKALVQLQITKGVNIPVGSVITITASLLGGSANIAIIPPALGPGSAPVKYYAPGALIQGTEAFDISSVAGQTGQLIDQVNRTTIKADKLIETVTFTAANLNKLLLNQQLKQNLLETTQNIDEASREGVILTEQLHQALTDDNSSIQTALGNVDVMTDQMRNITLDNKAKLDEIVSNLNSTTATLNQLTQSTNRTLTQGNVVANLSSTVENMKQASANFEQITDDFHKFSSDPKVQANLRTTVDNLAQTTTNTKILVSRLSSLVGNRVAKRGAGEAFLGNLDFTQNLRTNKFRTDADLYAPLNNTDFIRLGIYDITESNQLNLQYGSSLPYNRALDARAGVYAGKVGVGLDYHLFRNNNLSLDLYDPNRLHLDLKARLRLSNQAALIVGGEDLTHNSGAVIGVELRR